MSWLFDPLTRGSGPAPHRSTCRGADQRRAVERPAGVEAAFPFQERQREGEGEQGRAEGGGDDAEARSHAGGASAGNSGRQAMGDTGLLAQLMGQAADDGADLLLLVGIAVRTGWPEWAR